MTAPVRSTFFTVFGAPATKGSTVSFMGKGGRIVTKTDSTGLGAWTQAVGWAAREAGVQMVERPRGVMLGVTFQSVRPKSAKARMLPTVKPDVDKTLRALLDALTGVAYEDDAQVVSVSALKVYGVEALTEVRLEVLSP